MRECYAINHNIPCRDNTRTLPLGSGFLRSMSVAAAALICGIFFASLAWADALPTALYQGYDTVAQASRNTAIVQGGTAASATGASHAGMIFVKTDYESLSSALDASASGSIGDPDVLGGKANGSFVQKIDASSFSLSVIVWARQVSGTQSATSFMLDPHIAKSAPSSEIKFFKSYGDTFVNQITFGGEYRAVYTFYTQTKQEQTNLKGQLAGAGIVDGVPLSGNVQTTLDTVTKNVKVRWSEVEDSIGTTATRPVGTSVIAYAQAFGGVPLDKPTVVSFQVSDYEHVPGLSGFSGLVSSRNYFHDVTKKLADVIALKDQALWMLDTYRYYGGFSDPKVQSVADLSAKDISQVLGQIASHENNPLTKFKAPVLASLQQGVPALDYVVLSSQNFGPLDSSRFDDVDAGSAILMHQRPKLVQLRSANQIDSITITYETSYGDKTLHHGGTLGSDVYPNLTLHDGTLITHIEGVSGSFVTKLVIVSSDGTQTAVDTHQNGGGFGWTVPPGCFVIGFSGSVGSWIDGIVVRYGSFRPALWS